MATPPRISRTLIFCRSYASCKLHWQDCLTATREEAIALNELLDFRGEDPCPVGKRLRRIPIRPEGRRAKAKKK